MRKKAKHKTTNWLSRSEEEAVFPLSIPDLYSNEIYLLPFDGWAPWCCMHQSSIASTNTTRKHVLLRLTYPVKLQCIILSLYQVNVFHIQANVHQGKIVSNKKFRNMDIKPYLKNIIGLCNLMKQTWSMTYSIFSFQIRASWMLNAAICSTNQSNKVLTQQKQNYNNNNKTKRHIGNYR